MGSRGSLRGDRAWGKKRGVAGGLEQGSWGLGRFSKGLGGWGLEEGWGLGTRRGGWSLGEWANVFLDVQTFDQRDGQKFPPLFYRTLFPLGPLPCPNLSILKKTAQGQ